MTNIEKSFDCIDQLQKVNENLALAKEKYRLINKLIGSELFLKRRKQGTGLRELARRMGFSATYIRDLERGRRKWSEELINQYLNELFKDKR